ncbi:hypothetical protein [Legionella jordanis]|uniref:Uncharacterized protein n=1 Tax=Legionella jordanis TaxID=456 RepID=A0A0W0VBM3_9GAMM|nr:hypothetical protein [Legionella jordanis]KTD17502.1 hypothetical protein Ljor_1808 [Legionella jordanis]RMX05159.1 hypothetical protein EAW55_00385 [Legionella jordanis]RMX17415.1 hypothetical protein EAS68_11015 [Legionella jordanis]VEH13471.1 Uncharacterised protein [Legionella jordanis]HAT8714390.1 hypothetical protein [Legionella jordanis]
MADIYLSYSFKDEVLLISCSHNAFNSLVGSGAHTAPNTISHNKTVANDKELKNWLHDEFSAIKTHSDYSSVKKVVYIGDVNLNHSAKSEFPLFIRDNFIKDHFSPHPVQKVLFSADEDIVQDARALNIPDATVVITQSSKPAASQIINQMQANKKPASQNQGDEFGILTEENEEDENWVPPENEFKSIFKGDRYSMFHHDASASKKNIQKDNPEPDSPESGM